MSVEQLLASLSPGGRDFERLCKWLLENVPEYRTQLHQVWLWNDWPGGRGRDIGIDLVAEEREGGLWAIQAKHYAPAYSIKKADLDSFLSASSRAEFTYRLLIATTDHLGPNARSTLAIQEKPVGILLRSQLDLLEVAWPTSISRLRPAKPIRKRPRPHQRRAIGDCVKGLATADRGQLIMACGTGKTLIGPFLAEQLAAKRVLVLVPSLSLLGQTLREWANAVEFDYLAVCSDDTVTKDEQDAVVASTTELGIPVTTDPERIARFLRRRGNAMKVVLATYQSSPQIAAAQARRVPAFDLVIADEAHRCAGPQAGTFAIVLDAAKIKAGKRLFMTATPRYFTGRVKKEAKEADWEVASMDEEAKFGSVLHRLTFAQAIDQDLLSDYQVVVVGVSDSEAHDLAERGAFVTRDGQTITDARTLARQIGLLRAMAKYDLRRIVSFHSRIDGASRFASSLSETNAWLPARRRPTGVLWTDHVSGKMTAGERDARLRRLERLDGNQRGVLTNSRCLNEGVDVPTLDGVAFIDPRRSQVDVIQAVGRAIRKTEDKTVGTIVIPVLVDEDADPEVVLLSSEFKRVWEVVKALRSHDEDLADELDALRRGQGQRGTVGTLPPKIVLDLPSSIGADFALAFDTKVVEVSTSGWEYGLGAARAYWGKHGHLRVPYDEVTDQLFRLGNWISLRRADRDSGRLPPSQVDALEELGMVWSPFDEDFALGLEAARTFRKANGHLLVPAAYVTKDGYRLGGWISARRGKRRAGRLDAERTAALDALGMVWDAIEEQWQQGLRAAQNYRRQHGDLRVPQKYRAENGFRLGGWLTARRVDWSAGKLPQERIEALDALDMIWDVREEDWRAGIASAKAFRREHGHLRVSRDHVDENGFPLGSWLTVRRTHRRNGRIRPERVAQLDALGMVWSPQDAKFERALAECRRYREVEGNLLVPPDFVTSTGFNLGAWVNTQRTERRRGSLNTSRIAALDEFGMTWEPASAKWQRGFDETRCFSDEYGHASVPRSYVTTDGFRLGTWLDSRRAEYRRGTLSPERVALFESIPGWTWDPKADAEQYPALALSSFVSREGHAHVPSGYVQDGVKLGAWVTKRRVDYRSGRLDAKVISRLEALPGWVWDPFGAAWERGFGVLQEFVGREGHARVRQDWIENGFRLGGWIRRQKRLKSTGKLSADRIARLEGLPGWTWDARR